MLTYMHIGSCCSLIPIFLLRCLTVVSRKLLIEDINFTCPTGDRTVFFTWSFDPREGLAVCRVKAVHKKTPSTHLPDTHPVKESGRVRCRHLCQVCCPLKDRPTAIWNGAQILHHACINQYDSLLGEVNGWKWIDYKSCTLWLPDLIDHHILTRKLSSYDIPRSTSCWIIDFLVDRK